MSSYCSQVGHGLLKPGVKLIWDALQQAGEVTPVVRYSSKTTFSVTPTS
jgi:hypothetical protein